MNKQFAAADKTLSWWSFSSMLPWRFKKQWRETKLEDTCMYCFHKWLFTIWSKTLQLEKGGLDKERLKWNVISVCSKKLLQTNSRLITHCKLPCGPPWWHSSWAWCVMHDCMWFLNLQLGLNVGSTPNNIFPGSSTEVHKGHPMFSHCQWNSLCTERSGGI